MIVVKKDTIENDRGSPMHDSMRDVITMTHTDSHGKTQSIL